MDLFADEQLVYDKAVSYIKVVEDGTLPDFEEYKALLNEYGSLLKQLRRMTNRADRTNDILHQNNLELNQKVHYDVLTGIYNRRFMEENLRRLIRHLSRSGSLLSIMLIDVDFFKKYNDTYGHDAGDACLREIAETLSRTITREDDFVARYGGEEFIVALPHTDEHGAHLIASRFLEAILTRDIPHGKSDVADCITISIGVTSAKVSYSHKNRDYIKKADEALYMSKRNGRNKYTFLKFCEEDTE